MHLPLNKLDCWIANLWNNKTAAVFWSSILFMVTYPNYKVISVGCSVALNDANLCSDPHAAVLQIQDLAIRCVQKNIKKNRGVKDWPWWKLFTTVRPLIQVQLSEEQIRGKDVCYYLFISLSLTQCCFLFLLWSLPLMLFICPTLSKAVSLMAQ